MTKTGSCLSGNGNLTYQLKILLFIVRVSEEVACPESIIKAVLFYWQHKFKAQVQSWCLATELDQ